MESTEKKKIELAGVCVLLAALAFNANVQKNNKIDTIDETERKIAEENKNESKNAEWEDADLTFWYKGEEYDRFFAQCARDFEKEYGVKVNLNRKDTLNYDQNVYQTTIDEVLNYPDVFLSGAEQLRKFKLAMIAAENKEPQNYGAEFAQNAVKASSIDGRLFGYPLAGNTYIFAYQNDFFEKEPASFAELLQYAQEKEPEDETEKLLEWDLSDGYCNFTFVGNAIAFEETDQGLQVHYEEEKYKDSVQAFQNLGSMIALQDGEKDIVANINAGTTLAAILPVDAAGLITNAAYSICAVPKITEEIASVTVADTDILIVNALSEQADIGAAFADFVCNSESENLGELSGKLPVKKTYITTEEENICFEQYEASKTIPDTLDHTDFWIDFQKQMEDYWNGKEIGL